MIRRLAFETRPALTFPVCPVPPARRRCPRTARPHVYDECAPNPPAACNGCNATQYADGVRDLIAKSDSSGVSGYGIVDLRGNNGGNIWPMIAGIGPLLGNGTAGAFVDPCDQKATIGYQDGVALAAGVAQWTLTNPYQVYANPAKVAVITDISTSGGGEILAILFRGRPNTRSFGIRHATFRVPSATYTLWTTLPLPDHDADGGPQRRDLSGLCPARRDCRRFGEAATMRAAEWLQGSSGTLAHHPSRSQVSQSDSRLSAASRGGRDPGIRIVAFASTGLQRVPAWKRAPPARRIWAGPARTRRRAAPGRPIVPRWTRGSRTDPPANSRGADCGDDSHGRRLAWTLLISESCAWRHYDTC